MGKKTTDKPIDKTIYQTPKGYFMEHDCTERISEQKSEYEELMEADTKAGKLVQNAVASVRNQKGQDEIEEAEAMEKINQYLAAHGGEEGNQYLVRGAELVCTHGSNQRKLNLHVCHGVYIKGHPVVHELDCIYGKNITWFGACDNKKLKTESIILVGDDGRKHGGKKCEPHIVGVWMDTYDGTKIVDNGNKMVDDPENPVGCNTLTVGSFLVCKYGGIITPISSGQDREVKETEFIEGEAAYNRVMNFKCEEEIDRADGCDDLLHAMTKESADVHGSAFLMEEEGNGEEGSAEIGTKAEESSNKGEEEIDVGTISSNKVKYYNNIEKLVSQITEINADGRFTYDIKNFKDIYERNIDIYEEISQETGVPPALIAALHYRESGCNFTTYLHNGQPLGQKTTIVPKDVLYYDFTEAAIDAINSSQESKGIHLTQNSDIVMMMTFAELYNGTGYTKYHNMASPYVFSGTNVYEKGKYTGDGSFDSEVVDKQPGVYILVMSVLDEECNE